MRDIPANLAAHLAGGATTLARCWTLTRRDGVLLAFTDHDRDLTIAGVTYAAQSGLEASQVSAELGLAVTGGEVIGALTSAALRETDIARGLYDGARIETFIINWADPSARMRLDVLEIGEIRRGETAFVAEVRTLSHAYDEERGRVLTLRCGADLGDARCKVSVPSYTVTVAGGDGRRTFLVGDVAAFAAGAFTAGRARFVGGANDGFVVEIRQHTLEGGLAALEMWLETPAAAASGDGIEIRPGCDKSYATCRDRFANALNFRGFPHIPGNELLARIAGPDSGMAMDGGSLFR
jgi:uncharacterized phage protein (TIGR02218 family)